MSYDETAFPTNANEQIAGLKAELHQERAAHAGLRLDLEMVLEAAGVGVGDPFSLRDHLHDLHKMIHELRYMLTEQSVHSASDESWTVAEVDDKVGVEPRCSGCNGFGPGSGQALVPIELKIKLSAEFDNTKPDQVTTLRDMVDKLSKDAAKYGFEVMGAE